ncbi:MAG: hypothetical protein ACRC0L_10865, partial [Angustibacter sp.]
LTRDRIYTRATGRWLGTDPVTPDPGTAIGTPYSYVNNQPGRWTDPLGDSLCEHLAGLCDAPTTAVNILIGVGQGITATTTAILHPIATYHAAIDSCNTGFDTASGGTGPTWTGLAQCTDNLNPIAAIRRDLTTAFTNPCLDDAGQAFGRALFGAGLTAAPGIKGLGLGKTSSAGSTAELPGLPSTAPVPLARGTTGRTTPANLKEQLAMTEVRANPDGRVLDNITMRDPRWPATEGWEKVEHIVKGITIHYVRNEKTGAVDDFKFVGDPR